MKKKKIIIAITSSLLVLTAVASATFFAIFQSGQKAESSITTGVIDVQLIEKFTDGNGNDEGGTDSSSDGLENATKIITGKNVGTQPAYVRVKIFPQAEYYYSEKNMWSVDGNIPSNFISYVQNNDNWVDGGDGYLYYSKVLQVGEATSEIKITNMKLTIPDGLSSLDNHSKHRINMDVQLESSQSSNELYKINWGIDSLPAGVEIVQ